MQFTMSVAAFMAMAASVLAQTEGFNPVYTPLENEVIPAGSSYEITWDAPADYADGTVSITLIGGKTQGTQVPLQLVVAGVPNAQKKFTWAVDANLGAENVYGLKFTLDSNPEIYQFSMPFTIDGEGAAAPSGETSAAATVTSAYGIKTVTLSTAPEPTTTTSAVTTTKATTSSAVTTSTVASSTVRANTTTLITSTSSSSSVSLPSSSTVVVPPSTTEETAPVETTPGNSGAASLTTSFVAVAGLVMAYMAL